MSHQQNGDTFVDTLFGLVALGLGMCAFWSVPFVVLGLFGISMREQGWLVVPVGMAWLWVFCKWCDWRDKRKS